MIVISIVIEILIDFLATSVTELCTCWVLQPRFLPIIFFFSFLVLVGLMKKKSGFEDLFVLCHFFTRFV